MAKVEMTRKNPTKGLYYWIASDNPKRTDANIHFTGCSKFVCHLEENDGFKTLHIRADHPTGEEIGLTVFLDHDQAEQIVKKLVADAIS